jgi:hypothetical protein
MGLPGNVLPDFRLCSRTIYLNPVLQFMFSVWREIAATLRRRPSAPGYQFMAERPPPRRRVPAAREA